MAANGDISPSQKWGRKSYTNPQEVGVDEDISLDLTNSTEIRQLITLFQGMTI